MSNQIEAILFDMGGTLRSTYCKTEVEVNAFLRQILALTGAGYSEAEFTGLLARRAEAYKCWAQETLVELNERELWTQWMLPEIPAERVSPIAIQLNQLYREAIGTRIVFPETHGVILQLFRRGYRLGLVSNTTSSVEVPAALKDQHISGCFETIVLSAVVGKRKPDPAILLEATHRMGIAPEKCAYVGDRIDRDVAAARRAGFSRALILRDPRHRILDKEHDPSLSPDAVITNLTDLLEIFPVRPAPQPATVYEASLSTMWAIKNFPTLVDFFEAARRMGFAHIELNHKVNSAMLAGIDMDKYMFSSVHEPCPADISADELKKRDWLVSSTDKAKRIEGINAIKKSIAMAHRLGAESVVIHVGHAIPDKDGLEKRLRALIDSGQEDSEKCETIRKEMITLRLQVAPKAFDAVKKSMLELLDYARQFNVCLGIENRYHYLEFPGPEELGILLDMAEPERLGFIFDSGHARTLARLGFFPENVWLERFAARIVGTHLHDVVGTTDHFSPDHGEVDFDSIAPHLPEKAFRTCEFQSFNTYEQVKSGLENLAGAGCIKKRP